MEEPTVVGECSYGKCLYAARHISKGEVVLVFRGRRLTFQQTLNPEFENYTVQVGPDDYILPESPGMYINHSCDPNAGFSLADTLVALRDIDRGEQVCFDYSTSMDEESWTLDCCCGSPRCRKTIRDFDTLPEELRAMYLSMNVVPSWLREVIGAESDETRA